LSGLGDRVVFNRRGVLMEYQNPQTAAVRADPALTPVAAGGRTVISETAVAKVAGIAARAVPGVYSLGTGSSRAIGAIRDAVGSSDHAAGVRAEVGETQVAVDITLVAVYGTPLHALANQVRASVYAAVEKLVGLQVIEVNVEINDVYIAPPVKPTGAPAAAEREAVL
jgi:uncharacterized alkaline shock family protein YloU